MGRRKTQGFTLIEILVVVGILGLLLAVLVPVVRRAQISAQEAAVKAQQHNISSGLEMFKGDFGYYPSSTPQDKNGVDYTIPGTYDANYCIQGFHRLAFALLGRDKLGCPAKRGTGPGAPAGSNPGPDSLTGWYYSYTSPLACGTFDAPWVNYTGTAPSSWSALTRTPRKTPYINPEGFSIVNDEVALGAAPGTNTYVPVICDKLDQRKGENITQDYSVAQIKRSMVLYFAANTAQGQRISTVSSTNLLSNATQWSQEYYYWTDNGKVLLPLIFGTADVRQRKFGDAIEDKSAQIVNDHMPHNKDGYILLSPGPDLQYMTKDDILNWAQ